MAWPTCLPGRHRMLALCLGLMVYSTAQASEPLTLTAQGDIQVAFSPGDDAGALVKAAIRKARRQILVQAYSFTHRAIATALVEARGRGVEVAVLADQHQAASQKNSVLAYLVQNGIAVWLDGEHAAAHDKVMVIDADTPQAVVITGSFNFSHAAQFRNSENLLVLRGNPLLARAYAANWRRHRTHGIKLMP